MANRSEEYPEGRLDRATLKSFFSITGEEGSFVYTPGNERIPDNWYRRAIGDDYGVLQLVLQLDEIAISNPQFFSVGGNTGQVNTFTGVDIGNLTGGVYNAVTFGEGNNLACFVLQLVVMGLPNGLGVLAGVTEQVVEVIEQVVGVLQPLLNQLDCPQLEEINEGLLTQFPGYSYGAGQS